MKCLAAMVRTVGVLGIAWSLETQAASPKITPPAETGPTVRSGPVLTPGPVVTPEDSWSEVLDTFAIADAAHPAQGGVVFTGSSSIRLWTDLEKRYRTYDAVNRGFGGSKLDDLAKHVDRLVVPHRPRLVVIYSGDNDLASGESAEQVVKDFIGLCDQLHRRLPKSEIAFVSIKPSPARIHLLSKIREANTLIRAYAATKSYIRYVDIFSPMLDAQGKPRAELFVGDELHMNERGYALWDSRIAPILPMRDRSSPIPQRSAKKRTRKAAVAKAKIPEVQASEASTVEVPAEPAPDTLVAQPPTPETAGPEGPAAGELPLEARDGMEGSPATEPAPPAPARDTECR